MIRVTIELTNKCNLNCGPCPRHHIDMEIGYMDPALFHKIVDQLPTGTTVFPFWRGESVMHRDFPALILDAYEMGMELVLATNGTRIRPTDFPVGAFRAISVSIHNRVSLTGMHRLVSLRGPDKRPELQASIVQGEDTGVSLEDIEGLVDTIRIYQEHTLRGQWGAIHQPVKSPRKMCSRLETDLVISWDGSLSRCCYVWVDPVLRQFNAKDLSVAGLALYRSTKVTDNYPDEICSKCDQWMGEGKSL